MAQESVQVLGLILRIEADAPGCFHRHPRGIGAGCAMTKLADRLVEIERRAAEEEI